MDATLLANLAAYSAQVVCIAALGTLLAALLHIDAAGVRYAYWRVLLGACVVLPFIQVRRDPAELAAAAAAPAADPVVNEIAHSGAPGAVAQAPGVDWLLVLGVVLAGGVLVRLMFVAASLISLRRMRTLGRVAAPCSEYEELQRLLGTRAGIRYVDGLRQPVTFGTVRPVVLLPASILEHSPDIQRAVLCHELFHVQRRDWLWVLGEEAVRAVLWFNPAVWWLIARVQLAREELVDELTVLATNRRRTYIEALLTFADETPLAPAAAFARRRHLFRRMVLVSKEAVMSSRRVTLSCAVMALVMLTGSWYVVGAFPLTRSLMQVSELLSAPGPLEKQAKPITAENPIPRRVHHAAADYPVEADAVGMTGSVALRITLDQSGQVAEVRQLSIAFRATNPQTSGSFQLATTRDMDAFLEKVERPLGTQGIRQGVEAMQRAAFDAVRHWSYDPPFDAPISFPVSIQIGTPPPPPPPPPPPAGVVRVGGNIKAPTKVRHVAPVYPEIARAARVTGVVIIEATVGSDGSVEHARVLRSIPLLDEAALDAVRQWQFTPTLLNGVPVPVLMTMTVNFTLQ